MYTFKNGYSRIFRPTKFKRYMVHIQLSSQTLKDDLAAAKQQLLDSARNYEHEIEMLKLQKSALQRSHDQLEAELSASRAEGTSLKATVSQMAADASAIQCQLDATKVLSR